MDSSVPQVRKNVRKLFFKVVMRCKSTIFGTIVNNAAFEINC